MVGCIKIVPFLGNGPSFEHRVHLSRSKGKVRPWLLLGGKHSFGYLRTEIETSTETLREDELQHELTFTGGMGVSMALSNGIALGVGLDIPWVDYPNISLPGAHLSLSYRGRE